MLSRDSPGPEGMRPRRSLTLALPVLCEGFCSKLLPARKMTSASAGWAPSPTTINFGMLEVAPIHWQVLFFRSRNDDAEFFH